LTEANWGVIQGIFSVLQVLLGLSMLAAAIVAAARLPRAGWRPLGGWLMAAGFLGLLGTSIMYPINGMMANVWHDLDLMEWISFGLSVISWICLAVIGAGVLLLRRRPAPAAPAGGGWS